MRLNQNMFSMNIYDNYKKQLNSGKVSMNRISSGLKLNLSKDNPDKIAKYEYLKIQIASNDSASKNIQNTNSMIQIFDGSMQEINNSLNRLKELTVKVANDTLIDSDRELIKNEIDSIILSIDSIAKNTSFNKVKLIDDDGIITGNSEITTLIGAFEDENIKLFKNDLTSAGLSLNNINILTSDDATKSITIVDEAIKKVSTARSSYGAIQLRLENSSDDLAAKNIALNGVESRIGDADIAEEMANYSKSQILVQSATALMAQSNNFPLEALNILKNIR